MLPFYSHQNQGKNRKCRQGFGAFPGSIKPKMAPKAGEQTDQGIEKDCCSQRRETIAQIGHRHTADGKKNSHHRQHHGGKTAGAGDGEEQQHGQKPGEDPPQEVGAGNGGGLRGMSQNQSLLVSCGKCGSPKRLGGGHQGKILLHHLGQDGVQGVGLDRVVCGAA